MAFKMKGWSAFTKASPMKIDPPVEKKEEEDIKLKRSERPSTKEIRAAGYKAVEGTETETSPPDYEQKYSKEEIAKGAEASTDFLGTKSGGKRTKVSIGKAGTTKTKKSKNVAANLVGVTTGTKPTIEIGEGKSKKRKKKAKTNIFTGKKTIKIDPIDKKQTRVKREERQGKDPETGEKPYLGEGTAKKGVDWAFEGEVKQDKDISERKRKAQFDPKTGKVKEKYKSKLGFYRKTGREFDAKRYQEAGKEKQAGPSKKEQKKTDKEKEKASKPTWKEERARINKQHADKDAAEQAARVKKIEDRKNK